jgi:hypothetical protein
MTIISLLDVCTREMKTYPHKNLDINAQSSIGEKSQKVEMTHLSTTDKWINKRWHIHIM